MNKQILLTSAMAATLIALPGCSSGNDWDDGVVVDRDTRFCVDQNGYRVEDYRCNSSGRTGFHGGHGWYYVRSGSRLPYYGGSISDPKLGLKGSNTPEAGKAYGASPAHANMTRSAAVSRGGFGSSSRSFGGGRS